MLLIYGNPRGCRDTNSLLGNENVLNEKENQNVN